MSFVQSCESPEVDHGANRIAEIGSSGKPVASLQHAEIPDAARALQAYQFTT